MVSIKVCVGSSCHLKGSYDVITAFKDVLKKYDVEDLVELQASFCLGHCAKGVTVQADGLADTSKVPSDEARMTPIEGGMILHNINADNVEDAFAQFVYPALNI